MSRDPAIVLSTVTMTLIFIACSAADNADVGRYPLSARHEVVNEYHGIEVADPYRWLENLESGDTLAWSAAQNSYTESLLDERRIGARAAALDRYTNIQSVRQYTVFGGNTFYIKGWVGSATGALFVETHDNRAPRRLAGSDLQSLRAPDEAHESVVGFWPSPDGTRAAAITAAQGSSWGQLQVLDAATGDIILNIVDNVRVGPSVVTWSRDSTSIYAVLYDAAPDTGSPVNARVAAIDLETKRKQPVFTLPQGVDDTTALIYASVTRDGRQMLFSVRQGSDPANRVFVTDTDNFDVAPVEFFAGRPATRIFLGAQEDEFFFYSNEDAENGKVVAVSRANGGKSRTVVAEADTPITANSMVGGNVFGMFGDRIALGYLVAGGYVLKGFDLSGTEVYSFDVPPTGAIWGQLNGSGESSDFYFGFLGISEPASTYHVDGDGERTRVVTAEAPFSADHIVARRVYVQRDDGAKVPVVIAHRKDLELGAGKPTIMYGYGGFGWISFLWYQSHLMDWFENDGIFVVAGVRGGGEWGAAWHKAGKGRNRQVAVDDYLSTAEWLIENGYTTRDLLVANGGSLSGSLAGAAIVQRPQLFGAAIIDFPVLDVLRYVEFGSARFWTDEIGDPQDPEDFKALYAYSPYHAALQPRCLPPTLIRTGQHDTTTTPAHGYKFAAAAQASQNCENPVLLDVMEGASHDYGATPGETGKSHAVALEFLLQNLDYDGWR